MKHGVGLGVKHGVKPGVKAGVKRGVKHGVGPSVDPGVKHGGVKRGVKHGVKSYGFTKYYFRNAVFFCKKKWFVGSVIFNVSVLLSENDHIPNPLRHKCVCLICKK